MKKMRIALASMLVAAGITEQPVRRTSQTVRTA